MFNRIDLRLLLVAAIAAAAFGQQPKPHPSNPADEILALEKKMEAAVVRGDVAYVESVSASDLSFTHLRPGPARASKVVMIYGVGEGNRRSPVLTACRFSAA